MSSKSSRKRDTPQPNNPKRRQLSCELIYINAAAKRREPLSVVTLYMFVLCGMSQSVVKRSFVPRDGLGRFHCMHGRHNNPLGYPEKPGRPGSVAPMLPILFPEFVLNFRVA